MLKWAASFTITRFFMLAVIVLAFKTYGESSCSSGVSVIERIGQIVPQLQAITRAWP